MDQMIVKKKKNAAGIVSSALVKVLMYIFLISMSFVLIYPIIYMLAMAFRPLAELKDPTTLWLTQTPTLENIKTMWDHMKLSTVLPQSVFISVVSALLSTVICAITGYGFARFKFKEKGFWIGVLFATIVVPQAVLTIASYLQMKDFPVLGIVPLIEMITGQSIEINLLDTVWVYFLPAVFGRGLSSGIFILVFYQFFRGLPVELENSAYVDGAGPIRTFFYIAFPNMKPPTVVTFLLSMVWYWNDTDISGTYCIQLQTISKRLLSVYTDMTQLLGMANGHGVYHEEVPLIQAALLIAVVPMLLLFLLCQRSFVKSVATAGIVG